MSMVQRDVILRMIQQLAEVFSRVAGLKRQGRLDEAGDLLQQTSNQLFGPLWSTLERLEPSTAASLLSSREKLSSYAQIVQHLAELEDARGQVWKAQTGFRRALELHLEAARQCADVDVPTRAAIRMLRPRIEEARLSKAYRVQLERIVGPR
jgi:gentisate 1,2-dioxygenase